MTEHEKLEAIRSICAYVVQRAQGEDPQLTEVARDALDLVDAHEREIQQANKRQLSRILLKIVRQ